MGWNSFIWAIDKVKQGVTNKRRLDRFQVTVKDPGYCAASMAKDYGLQDYVRNPWNLKHNGHFLQEVTYLHFCILASQCPVLAVNTNKHLSDDLL